MADKEQQRTAADEAAAASLAKEAAKPKEAGRRLNYGWVMVGAAFLTMVIAYGSSTYGFGVFFKPLLNEFHWDRGVTSIAFSVYMVCYGTSGIFMGMLTDRYGPRLTMALGGLLIGTGLLLLSRVHALWQLYLYYGLFVGVAMGAFFGPLSTTVSRWFDKRRGLALGILMAGTGSGGFIVPPLTERLISSHGWRTTYLVTGILCWGIILGSSLLMKQHPKAAAVGRHGSRPKGPWSLKEALSTRTFWTMFAMYLTWGIAYGVILVHLVAYATDSGLSAAAAAGLVSILGLASVFGRLLVGSYSDRIGTKKAYIICFAFLSVSLVWLMNARATWMFYVFAPLFGFFYGGHTPLWPSTIAKYYGLESMGAIFGVLLTAATGAAAIGSPLGGFIFDKTNSYRIAFLVAAIGLALALILVATLRPPKKRQATIEAK